MRFLVFAIAAAGAILSLSAVKAHGQAADGVITTNFPKPGDTAAAPPFRLYPPTSYGDYSNMETDPTAITADQRDELMAIIKKALPAGIDAATLNHWADVKEGVATLQIVNNVAIKGATYTIVLPPNWKRSAKLPVLLSGNGAGVSNNQRLWKQKDASLLALVNLASAPGRSGLIAVYSNAGGTESQGIDTHTYTSVGAFFDFIGQNGGDPQNVITAGGSRGGGTALMWAINPLKLNYHVHAVFADIPPTAYGSLSQVSVLTYPNLGYIYVAGTHDPTAYLYSSPNGPQHPVLDKLIGTNDVAKANAISPLGSADQLKDKTELVIGRGTHDAFFPLWEFLTFDRRLTELGITHSTVITLGQGHTGSTLLDNELGKYIDQFSQNKPYQSTPGRFYQINLNPPEGTQVPLTEFIKNGMNADPKATALPGGDLPFTAEIPSLVGVGLPVDISVCGKVGATFSYEAKSAEGITWTSVEGTIDATECAHQQIKAPDATGAYAWTFTYNGQPISSINTPQRNEGGCGLPAVTTVNMKQPSPAEITANNGDDGTLGFGVDQYSAQESTCTAGP
jgi:hypothetical protein